MRPAGRCIVLLVMGVFASGPVFAQTAGMLSFQGLIEDSGGDFTLLVTTDEPARSVGHRTHRYSF